MYKLLILLVFSILSLSTNAQIKAVTEKGDEVVLYSDGTWKYVDENKIEEEDSIEFNNKKFEKNSSSTFLVKSNKVDLGIWIDSKKWSFAKAKEGEAAEYEFDFKKGDLYGMLITEKIEIPLELLPTVAVENAKEVAPDVKIIKKEYRTVNSIKVLMMHLEGTTQGIKFSYYGYYYSGASGTVQLVTYTARNLLTSMLPEIEMLINGLVELKK
jgi:hypothetical protein